MSRNSKGPGKQAPPKLEEYGGRARKNASFSGKNQARQEKWVSPSGTSEIAVAAHAVPAQAICDFQWRYDLGRAIFWVPSAAQLSSLQVLETRQR